MAKAPPTLSTENLDRLAEIVHHVKAALALMADNERGGSIDDASNCRVRFLYLPTDRTIRALNRLVMDLDGDYHAMLGLRAQAREGVKVPSSVLSVLKEVTKQCSGLVEFLGADTAEFMEEMDAIEKAQAAIADAEEAE